MCYAFLRARRRCVSDVARWPSRLVLSLPCALDTALTLSTPSVASSLSPSLHSCAAFVDSGAARTLITADVASKVLVRERRARGHVLTANGGMLSITAGGTIRLAVNETSLECIEVEAFVVRGLQFNLVSVNSLLDAGFEPATFYRGSVTLATEAGKRVIGRREGADLNTARILTVAEGNRRSCLSPCVTPRFPPGLAPVAGGAFAASRGFAAAAHHRPSPLLPDPCTPYWHPPHHHNAFVTPDQQSFAHHWYPDASPHRFPLPPNAPAAPDFRHAGDFPSAPSHSSASSSSTFSPGLALPRSTLSDGASGSAADFPVHSSSSSSSPSTGRVPVSGGGLPVCSQPPAQPSSSIFLTLFALFSTCHSLSCLSLASLRWHFFYHSRRWTVQQPFLRSGWSSLAGRPVHVTGNHTALDASAALSAVAASAASPLLGRCARRRLGRWCQWCLLRVPRLLRLLRRPRCPCLARASARTRARVCTRVCTRSARSFLVVWLSGLGLCGVFGAPWFGRGSATSSSASWRACTHTAAAGTSGRSSSQHGSHSLRRHS